MPEKIQHGEIYSIPIGRMCRDRELTDFSLNVTKALIPLLEKVMERGSIDGLMVNTLHCSIIFKEHGCPSPD